MAEKDAPLLDPRPQPRGADQPQQLQPAKPSSGTTVTIHVTPEHTAAAHRVLSAAGDTIGPMIGELLGLAPASAPAAPKQSHPAAQALVSGLLSGLAKKYDDPHMAAAAQRLEAHVIGAPIAAAAKPAKPSKPPRNRNKARKNKRKR